MAGDTTTIRRPPADLRRLLRDLRHATALRLPELLDRWRTHDPQTWPRLPALYTLLGERVLKQGEPLLAYDIVAEGLKYAPADVRLRQLQGLALVRSGASGRARKIFEELRAENNLDEETLGMLARTYKDAAAQAATPREARRFLGQAATAYAEAYRRNRGYWTGINAATTALLVGKKSEAAKLARAVRAACLRELKRARAGDKYWLFATLGEAALIARDWTEAADWYAQARAVGRHRFGDLQSSRRNARLLLRFWKAAPDEIERILEIPRVAVFVGHMIDQPGRAQRRFPSESEGAVATEIRRRIEKLDAQLGYASAACGSDILFLEAMQERGGETVVVLPYERDQFVRDSVDVIPNSSWRARFDRVLARATRVVTAAKDRFGRGGVSYDYVNQLLLGLASIRARQLETGLTPLVVWDRATGDGAGGTASAVKDWRRAGQRVEIIDLAKLSKRNPTSAIRRPTATGPALAAVNEAHSRIVAMLFADAVAFSSLSEDQVPVFVREFLGRIGELVRKAGRAVVERNTWGDGIYLVFSEVEIAGQLALDLCDLVNTTRWENWKLPASLNLRIGLHAGPVYEFTDPITRRRGHGGTHVSRAARIEPVTPAGQVYASEGFAALAAARQARGFACDYAGQTPMAKGYGTFPTYHVRRA